MKNLIAHTIRTYRARNGLSQAATGRQLGISQGQIAQLERGFDLPTLPSLQAISKFFGLTADQIGKFVLEVQTTPRSDSLLRRRTVKG